MQIATFLYLCFFAFVFIIYYIFPLKIRWVWLLVASYFFCVFTDIKSAVVLFLITAISFVLGVLIERSAQRKTKKAYLVLGILAILCTLFGFKYLNFSIQVVDDFLRVAGSTTILTGVKYFLPLGLSFYSLQTVSYLIDIYNSVLPAERNPAKYALYVAFFPRLISGPIERGGNFLPQIKAPKPFEYQRFLDGLVRIGWGFFKKLVVADRLAASVNQVFDSPKDFSSPVIVLAVLLFSFQIYIDFSAYCDIAIGSAKLLGYDLMENFNFPYFARSVTEFWRRWHISFTSWLRDYIFTPLNFATRRKRSKVYQYLNIFIVFLVSGIWHGANYTFIIWGLLHGAYQVIEAATLTLRNKWVTKLSINRESFLHRSFQIIWTFLLVSFAWIFFRAENVQTAGTIIKSIFTFRGINNPIGLELQKLGLVQSNLLILVLSLIIVFIYEVLSQKHDLIKGLNTRSWAIRWPVYLILIFAVIVFGYFGTYTTANFIYALF
jgi:alginate O-acetyltransferase complex protein AlgI